MPLMSKFCLICTFLCAPYLGSAQSLLADSLYERGDYDRASVAYEYAYFSEVHPQKVNEILLKKTYCLKQLGKYDAAYQNIERADLYTGNDSLRYLLFYESIVTALLARKADVALSKVQELQAESKDSALLLKILPFEVLALNELHRWEEAHIKYQVLAGRYGIAYDPYPEILLFKMKNPEKAMTLSYLLPGIGQMYAGYFWKGMVSMLLNVGMIGFSGWSFWNGYYFSGAFTGVALFYLSYNGGVRYAELLAKQYNTKHVTQFNEKVRSQVMEMSLKKYGND